MKLKRLDNSEALLPLPENQRESFRETGVLHLKNYFSDSLIRRLKSELNIFNAKNTGSDFKFASFPRYIDSLNLFELDSCVSHIGTDLIHSPNVFLFDGPIKGKSSCWMWIPLEDASLSSVLEQTHLAEVKAGDCVIVSGVHSLKKMPKGITLHIVGDESSDLSIQANVVA